MAIQSQWLLNQPQREHHAKSAMLKFYAAMMQQGLTNLETTVKAFKLE